MAKEHSTSDAVPAADATEALLAERRLVWAQFCSAAVKAVIAIAAILVLLDWALL